MAEEGKKYVLHGMYAECSMGTMKNYLNTDVGHGVVYQGQPLLNANDHTPQINLTHFGDCNSKMIYEEAKKQADEKYKAEAGDNFFERAGKALAKNVTKAVVTVQECFAVNKCQLDTPLPWRFCNEEHMVDGAPALTMDSVCPCKFGGIISIVEVPDPEPEEGTETEAGALEQTAVGGIGAAMAAATAAASVAAAEQQAYLDMMQKSYGFDAEQALLIQKAYVLSGANKGPAYVHDFAASMAAFVYGGRIEFGIMDGIPSVEIAQEHLEKLGLSKDEIQVLAEAVKAQHNGEFGENVQGEKDFAHEMAVYAGYFNSAKPHREILDMGIVQLILGDMETLNSYEGDVYSGKMWEDDMNTDMDALNIYNLYTEAEGQDFLEVMSEYNQAVLNRKINRAEQFLKNLGDGDAEKGLENLKRDLDYGGVGGVAIKLGNKSSAIAIEGTKRKFLNYIEAVRYGSPLSDALYNMGHLSIEKVAQEKCRSPLSEALYNMGRLPLE